MVEARYKGRQVWFKAEVTGARGQSVFDLKYEDGDEERGVARIRVRLPGQVEPPLLEAGSRVEARFGGGKKTFPAVVVNAWPGWEN